MIRFFVEPAEIVGGAVRLNIEDVGHVRALRLRPDEFFIVCDGAGTDYFCRLAETSDASARSSHVPVAEIIEARPSSGEPSVACDVYIAFAKGDRLDYAVQKSVELGARDIMLFPSARCVSLPGDASKRCARLQRIAMETAKQSGRGRVPVVSAIGSFEAAIAQAAGAEVPLFFYECEDEMHMKQALALHPFFSSVSIVTGPEGGFENHEAQLARSSGMLAVSLGPRILRCETAPAAALAALMYHTENL